MSTRRLRESIGEVLELYLSVNVHPRNEGGLAPSTYERYVSTVNRHLLGRPRARSRDGTLPPTRYAVALSTVPAVCFNEPRAPRAWREQMLREGVPKPTRDHAWGVLSAALSWAAASPLVGEIQTNGAILANEPRVNHRRSARRGGTGYDPAARRRSSRTASWVLSPQAVEAIRAQMLLPVAGRDPILALRDAVVVSLQYGLCARNQEVWGLRWRSVHQTFAEVVEVISHGQLDEWGKTEHSAQRRTAIPSILVEDLDEWRAALRRCGYPARDVDFVIPGDLGCARHRPRKLRAGAPYLTEGQAQRWGQKCFKEAVGQVAARPEFADILGATPYALRRGGISLRLRAEDPQTVAKECGTSLKMLSAHYAFAIDDLRRFGPRPVDVEWRAARAAQAERHSQQRTRRRRKLFGWFSARGRATRVS